MKGCIVQEYVVVLCAWQGVVGAGHNTYDRARDRACRCRRTAPPQFRAPRGCRGGGLKEGDGEHNWVSEDPAKAVKHDDLTRMTGHVQSRWSSFLELMSQRRCRADMVEGRRGRRVAARGEGRERRTCDRQVVRGGR